MLLTFDTNIQHPIKLNDFSVWDHARATNGCVKQIRICSVKSNGDMSRGEIFLFSHTRTDHIISTYRCINFHPFPFTIPN